MSLKFTRAVAQAQGLTPKAKNLLRVLADRADASGRSFARQVRLAEDLGVSERTIRYALEELEAAHWIVRERRFRRGGGRISDLITVRDAKAAAKAAARQLELPLMRLMRTELPVDEIGGKPAESRDESGGSNRQILPVTKPAESAGSQEEPITSSEEFNRSLEARAGFAGRPKGRRGRLRSPEDLARREEALEAMAAAFGRKREAG